MVSDPIISQTTEPDGLEVKVPVDPKDFHDYAREINNILQWFPASSYEVFGTTVEPKVPVVTHELFHFYSDKDDKEYLIQMGPRVYPVDYRAMGITIRPALNAVMQFNIGDLAVLPSREGLSMDPVTIQAIREKIELANTVAPAFLKTWWDSPAVLLEHKLAVADRIARDYNCKWDYFTDPDQPGSDPQKFMNHFFTFPIPHSIKPNGKAIRSYNEISLGNYPPTRLVIVDTDVSVTRRIRQYVSVANKIRNTNITFISEEHKSFVDFLITQYPSHSFHIDYLSNTKLNPTKPRTKSYTYKHTNKPTHYLFENTTLEPDSLQHFDAIADANYGDLGHDLSLVCHDTRVLVPPTSTAHKFPKLPKLTDLIQARAAQLTKDDLQAAQLRRAIKQEFGNWIDLASTSPDHLTPVLLKLLTLPVIPDQVFTEGWAATQPVPDQKAIDRHINKINAYFEERPIIKIIGSYTLSKLTPELSRKVLSLK